MDWPRILALIPLFGCGDGGWEPPSPQDREQEAGRQLEVDPPERQGCVEPVVKLRVPLESTDLSSDQVRLVEGEPSAVSLRRFADGEVTKTLEDRTIPTLVGRDDGSAILRPRAPLLPGQRYTVVTRSGALGTIRVCTDQPLPYLARLWPAVDLSNRAIQLLYCGETAPVTPSRVELQPAGTNAQILPGLDEHGLARGQCVRLVPEAPIDEELCPPPQVQGFALDPSPLGYNPEPGVASSLTCAAGEARLGPGCATVEDDRVVIRSIESETLWVLSSPLGLHVERVAGGGQLVIRDAAQLANLPVDLVVFDPAGRVSQSTVSVQLPPPRAHVVINEVLANPLGAEPQAEWVELTNWGRVAADLEGWILRDSGADVILPRIRLAPGNYLLLVREDFQSGTNGDVPVAEGTTVVEMPQLGKSGLANGGEALWLLDAQGQTVSRFPARAASKAGISIGRRHPEDLDDAADCFGAHADPGASPGCGNVVP